MPSPAVSRVIHPTVPRQKCSWWLTKQPRQMPPDQIPTELIATVIATVLYRTSHHNNTITLYHSQVLYFNKFEFQMVNRTGYTSKKKKRTPKTSRTEMTNVEKGMIIGLFYCLRNIAHVARIIGRPWTTIKSFLARACERQSLDNLPRPGRTPILSQRQRSTIIRAAKANRKMTRSDLFHTIGLCAANIDSTDLAIPNFYWYEQFG